MNPAYAAMHCIRRVTFFALLLLAAQAARAEWLQETREYMGTQVSVELRAEDTAKAQSLIEQVFAEFDRLDQMMNPWNPTSELSRINREAAKAPVTTTTEIVQVVSRALHYSQMSEGAFDISFASAGQHYDYRKGIAPEQGALDEGRANIDFRAIALDANTRQLSFRRPGLQIDLGGIAKGYAVDRAIALLRQGGIRAAAVSAGGDSRILGDMGDRPRTVGIRHPRRAGEYAVLIPLADTAISTSGDYERFFIKDGVRYHHILDPETGDSARAVQSASVLASNAIDSDALSTTVFVLGVEKGLTLINSLPQIDAIIIDGDGKLHYSEDLLRGETGQAQD